MRVRLATQRSGLSTSCEGGSANPKAPLDNLQETPYDRSVVERLGKTLSRAAGVGACESCVFS